MPIKSKIPWNGLNGEYLLESMKTIEWPAYKEAEHRQTITLVAAVTESLAWKLLNCLQQLKTINFGSKNIYLSAYEVKYYFNSIFQYNSLFTT